jgi:phosphatidylethanolamine/phosphatidyl-N-methylethanolamine N-methyltransferase
MIRENLAFLREFVTEFQTTGSCFPTSKWAARALSSPLRGERSGKTILELGPGTGSVTTQILQDMREDDRLTICEINPRFMTLLKEKLATDANFIKHKDRITFFEGAAQALPENTTYDVIVCALPFLNFEIETIEEIFTKLKRLSTEKTVMTYYEYIGVRSLRKRVSLNGGKERFLQIDAFMKRVYRNSCRNRERVWLNLLPINIYTLQLARA